jgi:hypothetical protein
MAAGADLPRLAVIAQSRRGGVDAVPFRQTVTLQTELLS